VTGSRARPAWMRASADIDLAQLRLSIRPAIRSQLKEGVERAEVRRWARRHGFFIAVDGDGFFAVSPNGSAARRVLRIDARPGQHIVALGRALGYPPCCCLAAGRLKEGALDSWAEATSSKRFVGMFRLIDPGGYIDGRANISHVPCSPRCAASLQMAHALTDGRSRRSAPQARTKRTRVAISDHLYRG
jgi:hypothetical protein